MASGDRPDRSVFRSRSITTDNDYAHWQAFANQYWPALYFIDANGRIRHHHFGEGQYERSEQVIQQLLVEAGARGISRELVSPDARGAEAAADWANLRSPENYLGYWRTESFASPGGAVREQPRAYTSPARLALNQWALSGNWTVQKEAVVLNQANGRIAYGFNARGLHLVMGPAARGAGATTMRIKGVFFLAIVALTSAAGCASGTAVDLRTCGLASSPAPASGPCGFTTPGTRSPGCISSGVR